MASADHEGPHHPLQPLQAEEITSVRDVLIEAGALDDTTFVNTLTLVEPPKADVLRWPEAEIPRRAEVLVQRRSGGATLVVVDLEQRTITSEVSLDGKQPPLSIHDQLAAIEAASSDPRWQAALRARGIDDPSTVQIDPWPTGAFAPAELQGRRLARCIAFHRPKPGDNGYARPISGLIGLVDLSSLEVTVEDAGPVAIPATDGNYDTPPGGAPFRSGLKPISITQPEGPSFVTDGQHVRWQNWDFRVSLHPIEGLVLHQIGYHDAGSLRPILYRASLAEMVVPYGDPDENFYWRNAFDAGEVGLGRWANALDLGCDCVGEIHYFDGLASDEHGNPVVQPNAICMHEEDYGILWKHTDMETGTTQTRRSRRLVVSSIYTLGNYEYGTFWYFYLDGTIQLEMKLTGIVATKAIEPGLETAFETVIAPGLSAPHHQHLFCFRLDFDIDGLDNTVYEVDVVARPSDDPANPFGNAFEAIRTPLQSEAVGRRRADAARSRTWHIVNESRRNALAQPVGYKLEPRVTAPLLADPGSSIGKRAFFATEHLWVTRHDDAQRHPAGAFPNQSHGLEEGIGEWVAADRPLVSTDVVVWHTFGPTHIARPEDWPIMPVDYAGFTLKPVGFFDRNPALDVPPNDSDGCHRDG
jgi:primary-amine oxidase